jgi:hypothetical protein
VTSSLGLEAVGDRVHLLASPWARGAAGSALEIGWQRLWLATQCRQWNSLALVPAGEGVPTMRVARALARAGACHLGHTVEVSDATSIELGQLRASIEAWVQRRRGAERTILALGPVLASPATAALARAADAAILCVPLGESSIAEAQRAIAEVGPERFLGSVCWRGGKGR